jgi:hypothetical protein
VTTRLFFWFWNIRKPLVVRNLKLECKKLLNRPSAPMGGGCFEILGDVIDICCQVLNVRALRERRRVGPHNAASRNLGIRPGSDRQWGSSNVSGGGDRGSVDRGDEFFEVGAGARAWVRGYRLQEG